VTGRPNTQFTVAVHALVLLAEDPAQPRSSEYIADSAGANAVYVRRVLGQLRTAGYVSSRPGVHGGWQLAHVAQTITLGDVWRVIEGDHPRLLGVHLANPDCEEGQDIQHSLTEIEQRATRAVQAELDAITVPELTPNVANQLRERLRTA
jgi:Rrf2 family protein